MNSEESAVWEKIFGTGSGATVEEWARSSEREYVRSMDQIALWSPRAKAKGRRLTAFEALESYGIEVLQEVSEEGSALLCSGPHATAHLVKDRRTTLNLDKRLVANAAKVPESTVDNLESSKRVPIRQAEKIARVLGLDERMLSWKEDATAGNHQIAVRLRTIGSNHPALTPYAVVQIAEAAWVADTQCRLQKQLGVSIPTFGIEYSQNYGRSDYPAYLHGYYLASDARAKIGLGEGPLRKSLREISEELLGIPVIQTEIGYGIAGVTVEVGDSRAIIINLNGANRNVYVRRATIAHELGHLLYDPKSRLNSLRVDEYDELDRPLYEIADQVEQRANAFAVEFMAPQKAVVEHYSSVTCEDVWSVMDHFGVSYTVAKYQIWNGLERSIPLDRLKAAPGRKPDDKWEAMEAYTIDYHPLHNIRPSRAGRFSAVVVKAAEKSIISWDTAAQMLEVEEQDLRESAEVINDLFSP